MVLRTTRRSRKQKGGAFEIDVSKPMTTASGAPLEVRMSMPDGAELARPAPSTAGVGGVLSMMGGRRKATTRRRKTATRRYRKSVARRHRKTATRRYRKSASRRSQRGGACGCMGIQRGGGSGTGGFTFDLNNSLGKVYADLPRGSCNLPQRGGAAFAPVGVSESNGVITSTTAGFGYGPASVFESKDGSAQFLQPVIYGKGAQLGGRRRHKKQKRTRKH
jgi:hypothetical protein